MLRRGASNKSRLEKTFDHANAAVCVLGALQQQQRMAVMETLAAAGPAAGWDRSAHRLSSAGRHAGRQDPRQDGC
jgi:hypothetical protein